MTTIIQVLIAWCAAFLAWAALSFFIALPTHWLWNWLMPSIFGLPQIGVAQAFGLLLLSGFLVGHKTIEVSMTHS
jgi:hypothetical protein